VAAEIERDHAKILRQGFGDPGDSPIEVAIHGKPMQENDCFARSFVGKKEARTFNFEVLPLRATGQPLNKGARRSENADDHESDRDP